MIYISVISHGHLDVIKRINALPLLAQSKGIKINLQDNCREAGLETWCLENNINYQSNSEQLGFGQNNNIVFSRFKKTLPTLDNGYFVVLNPDVAINEAQLFELITTMQCNKAKLAAIDLYKDKKLKEPDNSIRNYPKLSDFIKSFLFKVNPSIIDKNKIDSPCFVPWAAGSFLCFTLKHYEQLGGFDENFFMYCEDLDICYRSARQYNTEVLYCPNIKAIHLAQHANRTIFSKHFIWHLNSICRYFFKCILWKLC
ncbi:MAG: N-acetylglucosaminyl-diphospho-decaprenol L-rhamnosyltransferase [Colwellia sp.]|jgi:N-acetylglucosaminyl-diphospho-decaprenol L-rhamnosyltransferase